MGRLDHKVAIVTGAAVGIGTCIAELFASQGARVIAADLHPGMPSYLDSGGKITPFRHDVKSQSGWRDLIEFVGVNLGRLDILVNNAGINLTGGVMDTTLEQWRETLAVNTDGVFLGCQHAIGLMQKSGGGSIVNITAAAAVRPGSGQIAYTTSKAAVISMTQSIALWCAQHGSGIRCNSIAPGAIRTPVVESYFPKFGGAEAALKFFDSLHPIGHIGQPRDIAEMALFLVTEESAFVTGANMVVDGGYSISSVDGGTRRP